MLAVLTPTLAFAAPTLKLGDILVAEPATASISVVDPATGHKTLIAQGGLLAPANKAVGVALALDGDLFVVHRETGVIRLNPVSGVQSVLSQGGLFRDPWAIAVNHVTGDIYVADSGYDHDRPAINEAGRIIRVDPVTGAQQLIAMGSACTHFPATGACQNTTSAGSYLSHPYGIDIDYTTTTPTLIVADMGSFNGNGAIIRIEAEPNGAQTLVWGPSTAVPAPQVSQLSPLACPMGVTVEPDGNILTSVFTYPVPATPTVPPPTETFYGCAPAGIYRVNLASGVQEVVNANAPEWQANQSYALGDVIRDGMSGLGHVHRVVTAGVSQGAPPSWNSTASGTTVDGSVVWENIGLGANWLIPFGLDAEPAPTQSDPAAYNIVVGEEGYNAIFRLAANGEFTPAPEPLASDTPAVTSVEVITFTPDGGFKIEPFRSNGQPSGILPPQTTQVSMSLNTDVNATCRYGSTAGVSYGSLPNTFSTTGATSHSHLLTGLASNAHYTFYVRCRDAAGNENTNDFEIDFLVAASPLAGPVAAFGFEEGAGASVSDNSGNGHAGTVSGAAWHAQGRFGKALSFDGIDDWVTVEAGALLELTSGMTIEAWVNPASASGTRDILIKEGANADVYNLYARNWRGFPESNVFVGGSNQTAEGPALAANAWTHVAGTYDGVTVKLYVNGTQVGSRSAAGWIGGAAAGPLRIGGNSFWGEHFHGRIDEVRVYNRPLTQAEIQADMNTPVVTTVPDTAPPYRFDGQPATTLPGATTQATLSLKTDESATCRYATQPGIAYASMPFTFTTTGGTQHSRVVSVTTGASYSYHVRCVDAASNANADDYVISFAVAGLSATASSFSGAESPLSEAGMWDSPGGWADMVKSSGAYAPGMNAQARLVAPAVGPDQYSEITYDQNPGAASWVGVTTRVQGASDGSGYLAIAYAGAVQLYRADDSGALNFTQLASASVDVGAAPRRLRLESEGNQHRVYFNGTQVIAHTASGTTYQSGQPGIAASVFGGPQIRVLSFEGGDLGAVAPDVSPPSRFNGAPSGTLSFGTTQTELSLTTSENATCRFSQVAGQAYGSMSNTFSTTGTTAHASTVGGLSSGSSYTFYVRCIDGAGNANPDDYAIAFSVAAPTTFSSSFTGLESVLSESGAWESPGSWGDLAKNDGAYAPGMNAMASLVAPAMTADQYGEIVYDQDPGAATWVGVATRVQGGGNGSGYLAIVYAGEVRLYRADDSGGLNFTLLASAGANLGTEPRRLRLESQGNVHRVYLNGSLLISHNAGGTVYSTGQPGIAASVFGGPQVRIQSFEGGNLGGTP
jgi:hypothetical protein